MFVVKDPEIFATQVIPMYFDHNKFSSFARQLNFYGFRKMQSKPIRNSDYDAHTAKHVTFFNENFKRGRCDLLKNIQRSTRGGGALSTQDHGRDIQNLREQVVTLEQKVEDMATQHEERMRRLELDMLARMEQMMVAMQQQQQTQLQLQSAAGPSAGSSSVNSAPQMGTIGSNAGAGQGAGAWGTNPMSYSRNTSTAMSVNSMKLQQQHQQLQHQQLQQRATSNGSSMPAPPTLPPHPKQKQLPVNGLPGAVDVNAGRFNSLRGISTLSRGLSGLARGTSGDSSASAVLMRNSWEDKFFSMIMLGENDNSGAAGMAVGEANAMAMANINISNTNHANNNNAVAPVTVSDRSIDIDPSHLNRHDPLDTSEHDLSSVSSSDMP